MCKRFKQIQLSENKRIKDFLASNDKGVLSFGIVREICISDALSTRKELLVQALYTDAAERGGKSILEK